MATKVGESGGVSVLIANETEEPSEGALGADAVAVNTLYSETDESAIAPYQYRVRLHLVNLSVTIFLVAGLLFLKAEYLLFLPFLLITVGYYATLKATEGFRYFHVNLDQNYLDVGFKGASVRLRANKITRANKLHFIEGLARFPNNKNETTKNFTYREGPGVSVKAGAKTYNFNCKDPDTFLLVLTRAFPTIVLGVPEDFGQFERDPDDLTRGTHMDVHIR